jgi:hypothetical protein
VGWEELEMGEEMGKCGDDVPSMKGCILKLSSKCDALHLQKYNSYFSLFAVVL